MNTEDLARFVHRVTAPLRARVTMMVSRFVVDAVNEATKMQSLKVVALADEVLEDVEHFQPGGLSHHPLSGAEGVLVCVAGHRDHPIAVGVSNRDARPSGLDLGETVLYSASSGTGGVRVLCKADGSVVITPFAGTKVRIEGSLEVTGEVTAMASTVPISLSTHMHPTAPVGPPSGPVAPPPPP